MLELVGKIRPGQDGRDGSRVVYRGRYLAIRMTASAGSSAAVATRDGRSQPRMWAVCADLPGGARRAFLRDLSQIRDRGGFEDFVEDSCGPVTAWMRRSVATGGERL